MQRLCAGFVALAFATLAVAGDNVWTSIGPEGGRIRQLVIAPSAPQTLYAVGHGGAWKSVDGGAHWAPARSGITELTLQAVAVDPTDAQVVYAGSILGGGIYKSVDGGASWVPIDTGLGITTIKSLAVDPANAANVYAGTDCCGILKSSNAGASWTRLEGGLPSSSVSAIVFDPAASTVYAGMQSRGVYKSSNGGATWAAVNSGLVISSNGAFNQLHGLAIDPAAPGTLYAATSGAIFKTVDGGATWVVINGTLGTPIVGSVAVNPQTPAVLFIGVQGGVRRSVDGGATWTVAGAGITASANSLAFDPTNPTRVYAGSEAGVFVTANGGTSWALSNAGLANSTVQALVVDPATPSTLYAGMALQGVLKSTDGGATWNASNTGMTTGNGGFDIRALAIDPANPQTVYAGSGAGIFKTVNGGASWVSIEHGTLIRSISSIAIDPLAPNTIRVGTFFTGVFKSINGGDTWTTENDGLPPPTSVNALAVGGAFVMASTRAAGTFGHALASTTWQALPGLTPFTQLSALAAINRATGPTAFARGRDGTAGDSALYIGGIEKDDLGEEPDKEFLLHTYSLALGGGTGIVAKAENLWSPLPLPLGVVASTCPPIKAIIKAPLPGTFYAGGACGVLFGTDNGQRTTAMSAGLPGLQVSSLAVTSSGTDVYAGTEGGGVFRYTKSGAATPVTVVEYYNATLDHYFITWVPAEQANLDAGNTPTRWTRTGVTFKTYTTPQTGASPVCRYYIPPNLGDSHFFGRGTQECTATGQNNPSFVLESPDFMYLFLPSAGTCPAGTINVYRVFSNRPDANHRYMIDTAIRAEMVGKGWLVEGDGPDAVVMCAPQ